jgi:hypothetical protein
VEGEQNQEEGCLGNIIAVYFGKPSLAYVVGAGVLLLRWLQASPCPREC